MSLELFRPLRGSEIFSGLFPGLTPGAINMPLASQARQQVSYKVRDGLPGKRKVGNYYAGDRVSAETSPNVRQAKGLVKIGSKEAA